MRTEQRETKDTFIERTFSQAEQKYREARENSQELGEIVDFLSRSEDRRLGCWRRNWDAVRKRIERKPGKWEQKESWQLGKELEGVLAEVLSLSGALGQESEIYLGSAPDDKKNGADLVIHINQERNLLLAIDLTVNGDEDKIAEKLAQSYHHSPLSLDVPPESRKNNPKALSFVLGLSKDVACEMINRFYQTRRENRLENLRNDPVIVATLLEILEQIEMQSQKFVGGRFSSRFFSGEKSDCQKLNEFISSQRKGFIPTPETSQVSNHLRNSWIVRRLREISTTEI